MRLRGMQCILIAGLLVGVSCPTGARAASVPMGSAAAADTAQWLPWPSPRTESPASLPGDLAGIVAALQQVLDMLATWAGSVQSAASDALTRMIWESPGLLPQGAWPADVIGQVTLLPQDVRGALDAFLAKLQAVVPPGSPAALHQAYTAASPQLTHDAVGLASSDAILTAGAVEQGAGVQLTWRAAQGAAQDSLLPAAAEAARETGDVLVENAQNLPSTRAGVQLLVAGMGAGMREQADLNAAVGDRLTVLAQQTATVSQQIGALAATTGALVAQETERDRQALDARLGIADALGTGAAMFQEMLTAAGEPSDGDVPLDPLY
jgi:hypothetical protein